MQRGRAIVVRTVRLSASLEQQFHNLRIRSNPHVIRFEVGAWIFAQLSLLFDIATFCGGNVQRQPTFLCTAVDICTIRD